jgi:SAM-dependent methyltransferase
MKRRAAATRENIPMPANFKDHFSGHASLYSRFRPTYPGALFDFLADAAPARLLAWDCATGGGQAALALADRFEKVIATDASAEQIKAAKPHARVEYRVAPAEAGGPASGSVDLLAVAQALHWFDREKFYAEAKRTLKPGGVLAVWSYNLLSITPELDALVNHFYHEIVGPYWPPERKLVEQGYGGIEFPFMEISAPEFAMNAGWTLEDFAGYLTTWSSVRRFMDAQGADPVAALLPALRKIWGDPGSSRRISWPLELRAGRRA